MARSQPYRLQYPLTPEQVEGIDEMFQILFEDLALAGSTPGVRGLAGEIGARGSDGLEGDEGPIGVPGLTGSPGTTGERGPSGPSGDDGEDGLMGPPGVQGATGATGADGSGSGATIPGPQGDDGDPAWAPGPAPINVLPVEHGGTGLAVLPANRIPYGNSVAAEPFLFTTGFQFDGTLLTIPGNIAFPSTQVASGGANTLDDYEEGTWTPVLGGSGGQSGQVYSIQVGRYVKIGKIVSIYGRVRLSTLGTITGTVQLQGLPFTAVNVANAYASLLCGFFQNLVTSITFVAGFPEVNTTYVDLVYVASPTTAMSSFVQADFGNLTGFVWGCNYETVD